LNSEREKEVLDKAKKIKLILLDVDGVLTDGGVIYGADGEELKIFDVKDGLGIKLAQATGLKVGIISGRASAALEKRASDLKLDIFFQGQRDKRAGYEMIKETMGVTDQEVAYVADDINDLPVFVQVGLKIAVNDAVAEIRKRADYVTKRRGGRGAVREVVELILEGQNKMETAVQNFLK